VGGAAEDLEGEGGGDGADALADEAFVGELGGGDAAEGGAEADADVDAGVLGT